MRLALVIGAAMVCLIGAALAENADNASIPRVIGNRANGFNYQPTPAEVVGREKAAGVRPPTASEEATNRDLEQLDRDLLRSEGLSTSSVPSFPPR